MTIKCFGDNDAAICQDCPHVETPINEKCGFCRELITAEDSGFVVPLVTSKGASELYYHHNCHIRQVVGGLNHQLGNCICCGGTLPPDPPELSLRTAADVAVAYYRTINGIGKVLYDSGFAINDD